MSNQTTLISNLTTNPWKYQEQNKKKKKNLPNKKELNHVDNTLIITNHRKIEKKKSNSPGPIQLEQEYSYFSFSMMSKLTVWKRNCLVIFIILIVNLWFQGLWSHITDHFKHNNPWILNIQMDMIKTALISYQLVFAIKFVIKGIYILEG